ncbi:MAG: phosphonate ABC transporter, permease protein PhnE [Trueperaceae bacterium]|nr:phosphonate ABC transporter, permease protein PhnE [Trueperaceae bacterium]MCC6311981.1 phosphonate ABC transporter, permease protein PhnE [Trueperaceae bacterium]MCO5174713.1 phosphonate ABC transporter, permease protein PhnE [Trueperaceae bacterium]
MPDGASAPPRATGRVKSFVTLALVAALFVVAFGQTKFNLGALFTGASDFFRFFGRLAPDLTALPQIWPPLLQTIQIAYVATIIGAVIAIPLVFLASANTAVDPVSMWLARTLLTVLRSIPDLLWAALFVAVLGLGALPGVVALTLFSVGVLAKLGSETVESIDPGPLEALKAVGAGRNRTIVFAVVPQIAATMVSYMLYVFEINVRASVVIGFVGAGGIGVLLQTYMNFFDYPGLGALILVIFIVVLAIDGLSVWARSRLI